MPLQSGSTPAVISSNIRELSEHGTQPRSHDQIVAIALHNADKHPHMTGDHGTVGQTHAADGAHVMHNNAHPHARGTQEHIRGGAWAGPGVKTGENHGFMAHHVDHPRRNKLPEHHPPVGLE